MVSVSDKVQRRHWKAQTSSGELVGKWCKCAWGRILGQVGGRQLGHSVHSLVTWACTVQYIQPPRSHRDAITAPSGKCRNEVPGVTHKCYLAYKIMP